MSGGSPRTMSLSELSERSGVPARTIRYYIARQLMDGPSGSGRSAAYEARHLEQLARIGDLKGEGKSLSEIRLSRITAGSAPLPEPELWSSYRIAEDVRLEIRSDASPWRVRKLRNMLRQMRELLEQEGEGHDRS